MTNAMAKILLALLALGLMTGAAETFCTSPAACVPGELLRLTVVVDRFDLN
jgi:hypothetical protein